MEARDECNHRGLCKPLTGTIPAQAALQELKVESKNGRTEVRENKPVEGMVKTQFRERSHIRGKTKKKPNSGDIRKAELEKTHCWG